MSASGFPFAQRTDGLGKWLGGAYGLIGVGYGRGKDLTERDGFFDPNGNRYLVDAGAGYLLRIPFVSFASLRLDARYRLDLVKHPFASIDHDSENNKPGFEEVVYSVGLLIPLGKKAEPPAPPPPVVAVAPRPVCSDGIDNDGDGLIDFPTDKGCESADDADESDPCKTPAAGERITLKGCGSGDMIVLRGVNFEFDEARLTPNATSILDNVADELNAYPSIIIAIGGHTDAKGADDYNQKLSERRAAAVVAYLGSKGVAPNRMTSAGYGEAQPVADNESDEGRELNRRVELTITSGSGSTNASSVESTTTADPAAP